MADTAYIITRAFQDGKQLTPAQRNSSLFSEEPVVLGKILRRGSRPMRISGADYRANEVKLLALEKAGSILIKRPEVAPEPTPEQLAEAQKKALVQQHEEDHKEEIKASETGEAPPQQEGAETKSEEPPPSVPPAVADVIPLDAGPEPEKAPEPPPPAPKPSAPAQVKSSGGKKRGSK